MKNLLLVLTLVITATPAFASRARLEALGEGKNGSYYIQDSRNMFLNPASIVKHKKKLFIELGDANASNNGADSSNGGFAQGGFINNFGDYTYALYLNNFSDNFADAASAQTVAPQGAIEVQFAGENFANWGLALTTAGNKQGANSSSYLGARAGIEKDNLAVFATIGLSNNIKVGTLEALKGKTQIDAGVTYGFEDFTLFGKFATNVNDITDVAPGSVAVEQSNNIMGAGFGWNKEMTKSTHMYSRLEADYATNKVAGVITTKSYNIPVVLAAETQALSWLAIRGSIGHSLLGQSGSNKLAGLTSVGAGVGMTFGDVTIDGLVASGNNVAGGLGMGTGSVANSDFGFGDNMISRIAMSYNF